MIYTVTLNPALDKTVEIPSFTTDGVNRITSIRTDPGGKGINVSKVVAALGSTSRVLGILGGSTGQMISEALSGLNMTCDFLPVEGNTRINLKVVDPIAHTSTEINEPGVPVDPATLQSLLDHLLKLLRHDDIVVLAGSLPLNAPADTYRVWGDACREKGAKVILDSDGAGMVEGVKAKPFLIKPNSEELSHLMGRALDSQQELTAAARELLQTGVQKVIVSMGSRGMLHVLPEQTIFVPGLRVPVKDTVGAGDAVIAALAVAEERGLTLEQLSEATGISRAALGKYEADDFKDISPFSIAALAKFYGVSADYLMGLTETKNHPNTELEALHLGDDAIEVLKDGQFNHRLLSELICHKDFQRLMLDAEIYVDRIADMRINDMNAVLEAVRQMVLSKREDSANDLYLRTLELAQVPEEEYFSHVVADDLNEILRDIREAHKTDSTTADEPSAAAQVQQQLQTAMNFEGSSDEKKARALLATLSIDYDVITKEQFVNLIEVLRLSKHMKSPISQRGKGTMVHGKGKRKRK